MCYFVVMGLSMEFVFEETQKHCGNKRKCLLFLNSFISVPPNHTNTV